VQEARQREVDTQVYKYAGVAGVDKPRIVQVGYHATFLEQLQGRMGLARLINYLVAGGNVIAIRVLDRNMLTVDYSESTGRAKLAELTATDLANFRRLVQENRTAAWLRDAVLTVMVPIGNEGGELKGGAMLVSLPTDHVQSAIEAQAQSAILMSGLVLLLGSVIALVAAKTITNPIHQFTELTRRISGGDLTQTIEVHGQSELGVLASSFNEMSRKLAESMEHLKQTTAAKERIESELKIASEIQMSMLPKTFPPFRDRAELDIYAAILPAKEVGGDFYDFFFIDQHRLCLVIADVSGKGIPAALFMAVTKTLLRAQTDEIHAPKTPCCRGLTASFAETMTRACSSQSFAVSWIPAPAASITATAGTICLTICPMAASPRSRTPGERRWESLKTPLLEPTLRKKLVRGVHGFGDAVGIKEQAVARVKNSARGPIGS
jgi:HAMP domain-containing protein